MSKITKNFQFTYNLKKSVVRDLKIVTETLSLTVTGKGYCDENQSILTPYDRFSVDIEEIAYDGMNILPVFEMLDDTLVEIEDAAIREVAKLFPLSKLAV